MVMVRVEPVNSWGGGHVARPGASRAASRPANISTPLRSGEDSAAASAAVVNCESPVTPQSMRLPDVRLGARESGVKMHIGIPPELFLLHSPACIECGR